MDFISMGLLLLILAAGFIIIAQRKELQHLREINGKLRVNENKNEWASVVKDKLKEVGKVKTVKYVRDETGMSLVEATQFVDEHGGKKK